MTEVVISAEDRELDRQWRAAFGEPLPMLGCGDIVRSVLARLAPATPPGGPAAQTT